MNWSRYKTVCCRFPGTGCFIFHCFFRAAEKLPCRAGIYLLYYQHPSFSFTAVSYDIAGILNPWQQVYIIYVGKASSDVFFYAQSQTGDG